MSRVSQFAGKGQLNRLRFTERVPCPVCRNCGVARSYKRGDGAIICECTDCGVLYVNPRPTESTIASLYDASYFGGGEQGCGYNDYLGEQTQALRDGGHPAQLALHLLSNQIASARGKTLLDIGCADGSLLKVARQRGFEVLGVELSDWMAEQARKAGLTVITATLEDAKLGSQSVDAITGLEVIEHLTDPVGWLREICRVLRLCGWLLLSTPNGACASKYGEAWLGFHKSFEHLAYFNAQSLAGAMATAGLRLVNAWTRGNPLVETGAAVGAGFPSFARSGTKHLLRLVPPLLRKVQRWRQLHSLHSANGAPHGQELWVLATRE